jgi:hypothetical protein
MKGTTVEHPERLSGVWETVVGPGEAVGIHLQLITKIVAEPTSLAHLAQSQEHLSFGVYRRSGKGLNFGDQNFFMCGPDEGVSWDGRRLVLHWEPRLITDPAIDLDLSFDEHEQTWSGLFHRGDFSGYVDLRRPAAEPAGEVSPLVGTWADGQPGISRCLHVTQQQDGTLVGWTDSLQARVLSDRPNSPKPPDETYEYYGNLVNIARVKNGAFSFEFGVDSALCCSHTVLGSVSAEGLTFSRYSRAETNQLGVNETWRKVPGDSCR